MRVAALIGFSLLATCGAGGEYVPRQGDIIFHTSRSAQSLAIQKATSSPYSHMGIVYVRDGKPFVYEAMQPVKHTPLGELQSLAAFDLSDPVVKAKMRERWGGPPPASERFISPAAMFASDLLETVHER